MLPITYQRVSGLGDALKAGATQRGDADTPIRSKTQYLAGGTTLIDLSKLEVMQPSHVIDINAMQGQFGDIKADESGLHLGALARMADVADNETVQKEYPVIAQSLVLAASPQLRNMASLGGNVLQRTRCHYFRDVTWQQCNKRQPGSGCAAMDGVNRRLAVLGVSDHCIANYAGDFAQALIALDAQVSLSGPDGNRIIPFEQLHTLPGTTPQIETTLKPGELIVGFVVPRGAWTRRSVYVKVRDRSSYDFALASAAIALDLQDGVVKQARIALGGVATKPWRAHEAEAVLQNGRLDEALANKAAEAAFAGAVTHGDNDFKPNLGRRTLVRALLQAQSMEL